MADRVYGASRGARGRSAHAARERRRRRSIAPAFAGAAMQAGALWLPLVAGASIKIGYELLLWRAFRRIRPPEERRADRGR